MSRDSVVMREAALDVKRESTNEALKKLNNDQADTDNVLKTEKEKKS
ncbi:hypothetical protein AGMMS49921_13950 [Endomicrobiia bacterium]|nr:hypothetical protein AGMMS49921_13950 [Endomicrobiia bacterium]